MKKIVIATVLALFIFPGALFAGDLLGQVKELPIVKSLFPAQVKVIEARDLGSIYELVVQQPPRAKQIYYVTKDGKYLIAGGSLITKDRVNVTRERFEEINRVDFSKLPLKDAIVIKKGDGAKKLVMFSDVDCPFCRRAYKWLKTQTNYTLYVFLYPLSIHPKSAGKSVQILCAKDPEAAMERALTDKDIGSGQCEAGKKELAKHKAVGEKVGIDGTPLFVTATGKKITGLQIPALESYLKN